MIGTGAWKDCLIDVSENSQLSNEVDLGYNFSHVCILVPTITSAGISVRISDKSGGTFYPVYDFLDSDADTDVLQATKAEVTSKAIALKICGARFIKLYSSNAQVADVTFRVRGFNL